MDYGLIGEKLGHSFSGIIHGKIAAYPYELRELTPTEVPSFLQVRDFRGINVTIPYKTAVIPYLDELSAEAEAIGAVNTVVNRDGKLYGYNTDVIGLTLLLRRITGGRPLHGKVLILGSGGTSLTAVAAAKSLGASEVCRVSRSGKDGAITYEEALSSHRDASFLINTTPCGMYPKDEGMALDPTLFPQVEGVADAVFNPLRTPFVRKAQAAGLPAEGGLFMLVAQAVAAYGDFFDTTPDPTLVERIYGELIAEKENIVLIGMPSSGKSSVGKEIASLLGRPFYDTDEEIVKAAGRPIPELFASEGEPFFRSLETAAVKRLSSGVTGAVIATGGGVVLREENVDALRANGRLYFLDRPLPLLIPTDDRPLSRDADAVRARYEERYPLYCKSADAVVDGSGSVQEVAARLLSILKD